MLNMCSSQSQPDLSYITSLLHNPMTSVNSSPIRTSWGRRVAKYEEDGTSISKIDTG